MKKIFLFLTALVAFSSCEEDIRVSNPALQVMADEELLRITRPRVTQNSDGEITITGRNGFETLTIKIASKNAGTYKFGIDDTNVASYKYDDNKGLVLEYSTIEGVDNSDLEIDLGEFVIYPANHPKASKTPGTITGEFKFRGKILDSNPFGKPTIFFHQGFFYSLPVGAN